jgi:hypothetical protein
MTKNGSYTRWRCDGLGGIYRRAVTEGISYKR